MKKLILYSYRDYEDSAQNLDFFLKNADLPDEADLLIFYNGDRFIDINKYTSDGNHSAIKARWIKTEALHDLEDFRTGLHLCDLDLYDFFIFLNSSCVGPILPSYIRSSWIDAVVSFFDDETIKLVSPIVEIPPDNFGAVCLEGFNYIAPNDVSVPFAHTYFFCVDRVGLNILLDSNALPAGPIDKDSAIQKYERLISSSILNEGYTIKPFLQRFRGVNIADKSNWDPQLWGNPDVTCPEIPGNYGGVDVSPFEVLFFKSIRHPHAHRLPASAGLSEYSACYLDNFVYQIDKQKTGAR